MAMCSLLGFPALAPEGHISLCELEGRIQTMPVDYADILTFTNTVAKHPKICITHELLYATTCREDARQVFLTVAEPLPKRFFNVWCEQGLVPALQLIGDESENEHVNPIVGLAASYTMKFIRGIERIRNFLNPHQREYGTALVSLVSQTRDWPRSPVRCMAWHPHCTKIAVAVSDDSVRIYGSDSSLVPLLKSKGQRAITCMAWRPFSASELAVGCEGGVLVWQVDPNSVVTRLSPSCSTSLKRPHHAPVTSLAWSSRGDLLLTASAADTTMYVWDVAMETTAPMHKLGGGGVSLVSWSPDTSRVFAATSGIVFRVWETNLWTAEHWTVMSGHVQTACWSPCSSLLLFCTSEEPVVYSLVFKPSDTAFKAQTNNSLVKALPVIDLSQIELEDGQRIGGSVVSMVWDCKGRYLAILFRNSNFIAVFRTDVQPILQVSPCCFLYGTNGEIPNAIAFQENFTDGAVLTIAWSSGRVQYFPFLCTDIFDSTLHLDRSLSAVNTMIGNTSRRVNF